MFKQRWRIWLGALVVVIIVSGVVIFREIWRSEPVDPRAYAVDSGEISLKEGLARAEVSLPECAEDDLRYAFIDDGFEYYCKIYLKLEESRGCINEFLEKNAMVDVLQVGTIGGAESEYRIEVRSIWMDSYPEGYSRGVLPAESVEFEGGDDPDDGGEFGQASPVACGDDFPVLQVCDASFDG